MLCNDAVFTVEFSHVKLDGRLLIYIYIQRTAHRVNRQGDQ